MEIIDLSTVIAGNLRAFREAAEATQQDIADQMLQKGFPWRRETVAQSEGEGRTVSISEMLALGLVFGKPLQAFLIPVDDPDDSQAIRRPWSVAITENMIVRKSELIRLIRVGAPISQNRAEKETQKLTSEISSLEMKLVRVDSRLQEVEGTKSRLIANLEKCKSRLKSLEENGKDAPC